MDNLNNSKMLHAFSLPNLNFKTQMNINVDAGAHIKSIVSSNTYLYDLNIDCESGKCVVKGKVGIKIVYLDLDNMLNAISSSSDFEETVSDQNLTSDCKVFCYNEQITPQITFDERTVKCNLTVNLKLFSVIDLGLNSIDTNSDDLIVKNHPMNVCYYLTSIKNKYVDNIELNVPFKVNKVLCIELNSSLEKVMCEDGYITIEGQTVSKLIAEVEGDERECIKTFCNNNAFRYQIKSEETNSDCIAQILLKSNPNSIEFTSELDENGTTLKIEYEILTSGCIFKTSEITCPDDIYSTKNELELTYAPREFCNLSPIYCYKVNFDGEIQLPDDANVDEIVDLVNLSTLITQSYISNNSITLEGVAYANLIYLTEEKEIRSLNVEFPFSVSKDYKGDKQDTILNYEMTLINHKCKIKRGSTLSIDIEAEVSLYIMSKTKYNVLENINVKNEITYGDIAFQILIAKENETIWDFLKRAHCKKETLEASNKEIPPVFQGGEKIVIFR